MPTDYLAKAIRIITEGKIEASEKTGFVEFEEPDPDHVRLCEVLLRGGWRDSGRAALARDNRHNARLNSVEIDGGVLALYQLLGEPFFANLVALSRLTPNI